jgi:hypothetical protein
MAPPKRATQRFDAVVTMREILRHGLKQERCVGDLRHWVMTGALRNKTLKHYGFTLPRETATT